MTRSDLLQDVRTANEADALLLTFLPDVRWACGFTGSNGCLLVRPEGLDFVSDGRYREQALQEVQEATIHIPGNELYEYLARKKFFADGSRVVFQSDAVTVDLQTRWQALWPDVTWIGVPGLLKMQVACKSPFEIDRMRRAQAITDEVFEALLGFLRPGVTEREVAAEVVYQHLRRGAEKMAFDPIIASGPNGALPHSRPTMKPLEVGELVVLDFGCVYEGYASDMTRTIALGDPGDHARHVYRVVREAQQRALNHAKAGLTARRLDGFAREVIMRAGLGPSFTHGLGHGIGLQTHEWPRVSYHVDDQLPMGAVVTIEPGVYIPGAFGVRIEDMIVLREKGCENLTGSTKELVVL